MHHCHGERDLDWQPELQAERRYAAEMLGQAAAYLTSVQAIANEEFDQTGHITPETRDKLNEAHQTRFQVIKWLSDIALNIYEAEQ